MDCGTSGGLPLTGEVIRTPFFEDLVPENLLQTFQFEQRRYS